MPQITPRKPKIVKKKAPKALERSISEIGVELFTEFSTGLEGLKLVEAEIEIRLHTGVKDNKLFGDDEERDTDVVFRGRLER